MQQSIPKENEKERKQTDDIRAEIKQRPDIQVLFVEGILGNESEDKLLISCKRFTPQQLVDGHAQIKGKDACLKIQGYHTATGQEILNAIGNDVWVRHILLEFPNGHNIITMQHGTDFLRSESEIAEISHRMGATIAKVPGAGINFIYRVRLPDRSIPPIILEPGLGYVVFHAPNYNAREQMMHVDARHSNKDHRGIVLWFKDAPRPKPDFEPRK